MRSRLARTPFAFAAACSAMFGLGPVACGSDAVAPLAPPATPDAAASAPGTLSDSDIGALASAYRSYAKITVAAYATAQHQGNPMSHIYANAEAEGAYRSIEFGGTGRAGFAFAPGSVLVKEMIEPAGGAPILTVMYKKAPGYDPANNDWWYGRLTASGSPTNAAFVGKVDFCIACHAGTAQWDYAWGVASSNKAAK